MAFIGINHKGKVEIVSHSPKNETCLLPELKFVNENAMISDLNGTIFVYDGNHVILKFSSKTGKWERVAELQEKFTDQGKLISWLLS